MAIRIENSSNLNKNYTDISVHYVPCKIHADCDANASKYFIPFIETNENGVLTSSFRGYPLKGQKIDVPESYQGIVLHESVRPTTDKQERKFYATHKFNAFTNWNWDKIPSKNDIVQQALDWIDIAEALHAPVTEE